MRNFYKSGVAWRESDGVAAIENPWRHVLGHVAHDYANEQAQRAADIVLALKNFLCHQPSVSAIIDINKLIPHVIELMQPTLRGTHIDIQLKLGTGLPKLKCNQTQIELVFINLITNAIEAMAENCPKKRILITTYQHLNRQISISVEDTGLGIDDNIKEKLFFSFYYQ